MTISLPVTDQRSLLPTMRELRRALFVGVSYMIPFLAAGGLLQALGLLFGGSDVAGAPVGPQHLGALCYAVGTLAFGLLTPALAGYIAFALAERPGLVPGITTGLAASALGAGFLGGLLGGVLAGVAARLLSHARGAPLTVVLAPAAATLLAAGTMLGLLGPPLAALSRLATGWLSGLGGIDAVLLGAVLGAMIAVDLGGPVNKVAYTFAATGLTGTVAATTPTAVGLAAGAVPAPALPVTGLTGLPAAADSAAAMAGTAPMAAVMAAGMSVPLGLALATRLRPGAFTPKERAHAPTATTLGALFITESAIPYALADPVRVVPAAVLGAATAGALSMGLHATLDAPHGGVLALFAAGHVLAFLTALATGTGVTALAVTCVKQTRPHLAPETAGGAR